MSQDTLVGLNVIVLENIVLHLVISSFGVIIFIIGTTAVLKSLTDQRVQHGLLILIHGLDDIGNRLVTLAAGAIAIGLLLVSHAIILLLFISMLELFIGFILGLFVVAMDELCDVFAHVDNELVFGFHHRAILAVHHNRIDKRLGIGACKNETDLADHTMKNVSAMLT